MINRNCAYLHSATIAVLIVAAICAASPGSAQQLVLPPGGDPGPWFAVAQGGPEQALGILEARLVSDRALMENRMAIRVDELNRICTLSEDQMRKFRVAAKGAMDHWESGCRQIINHFKRIQDQATVQDDPDQTDDTEPVQAQGHVPPVRDLQLDLFALNNLAFTPGVDIFSSSLQPQYQAVWKSAINNTLTPEQKQKFELELTRRKDSRIREATNTFMSEVNRELFLTAEQREKLTLWVCEAYGNELREMTEQKNQVAFPPDLKATEASMPPADVAACLSSAQLEVWERLFAEKLEQANWRKNNTPPNLPLNPPAVIPAR